MIYHICKNIINIVVLLLKVNEIYSPAPFGRLVPLVLGCEVVVALVVHVPQELVLLESAEHLAVLMFFNCKESLAMLLSLPDS